MLERFFPNMYIKSIFHLNIDSLIKKGIKGILVDIDNTLVSFDIEEPTDEIIELFNLILKKGLKIMLISNNTKERVDLFNSKLNLQTIHKAKKPRVINIKRAVKIMNLENNEVALIGDQIFTDVFGGNRINLYTILVQPVSHKDEWKTKVKRGLEKKVIKKYIEYRRKTNE